MANDYGKSNDNNLSNSNSSAGPSSFLIKDLLMPNDEDKNNNDDEDNNNNNNNNLYLNHKQQLLINQSHQNHELMPLSSMSRINTKTIPDTSFMLNNVYLSHGFPSIAAHHQLLMAIANSTQTAISTQMNPNSNINNNSQDEEDNSLDNGQTKSYNERHNHQANQNNFMQHQSTPININTIKCGKGWFDFFFCHSIVI